MVGLVSIAVGSKLGDVNRGVTIVDEFYSGVNNLELEMLKPPPLIPRAYISR